MFETVPEGCDTKRSLGESSYGCPRNLSTGRENQSPVEVDHGTRHVYIHSRLKDENPESSARPSPRTRPPGNRADPARGNPNRLRRSLRWLTLVQRRSPAFKGPQGIRRKVNVHRGDFGLQGKAPDGLGRKEPVRSEVAGLGPGRRIEPTGWRRATGKIRTGVAIRHFTQTPRGRGFGHASSGFAASGRFQASGVKHPGGIRRQGDTPARSHLMPESRNLRPFLPSSSF